jgi:hypothetical protein
MADSPTIDPPVEYTTPCCFDCLFLPNPSPPLIEGRVLFQVDGDKRWWEGTAWSYLHMPGAMITSVRVSENVGAQLKEAGLLRGGSGSRGGAAEEWSPELNVAYTSLKHSLKERSD